MTPHAEIERAASDLRTHTRAVPGFRDALPELLEACADAPGETGELALRVAQSIRPPRRRTAYSRTEEGNDHA